jgi:hypothetical protein
MSADVSRGAVAGETHVADVLSSNDVVVAFMSSGVRRCDNDVVAVRDRPGLCPMEPAHVTVWTVPAATATRPR